MADKQLTVGIGIEYQNNGAQAAADDLKKVGDAAAGIDAGKLDLNPVGEALKNVGEGAGEAASELPGLNELLAQMAGKGAPAKDVFQGLVAAIKGGDGAIFQSAQGLKALIGALGTGPVGAFTIAIGVLAAALVLLKGNAADAEEKVNELGETASKEKARLKDLADQTLEFNNAKKGLTELDTKFSETQGVIDRMEAALARLRQSQAEAAAGAIGEKFAPAISEARAAGDEDAVKRLEEKRDAEIRQVNEARELADKTAAANATARKIQDTQEQIAEKKAAQDKLEAEYKDLLSQYVTSLRSARQFDLFPKDMEPEAIAEAITKLKRNLEALSFEAEQIAALAQNNPEQAAAAGETGKQIASDASTVQAAIDALQGFADLKEALEGKAKEMADSRESTTDAIAQYSAEVNALVVDLKTARTELVTELRQQVADAQARKSSAEEGLRTAAPGEVSGASTEYSNAIAALNALDAQLREAEAKLASSAENLKQTTTEQADKAKGKADAAAVTITTAVDEFGAAVDGSAKAAAADIGAGAAVVKDAAADAGGKIAEGMNAMGNAVERIAIEVTNNLVRIEGKLKSVEATAKAAEASAQIAQANIANMR